MDGSISRNSARRVDGSDGPTASFGEVSTGCRPRFCALSGHISESASGSRCSTAASVSARVQVERTQSGPQRCLCSPCGTRFITTACHSPHSSSLPQPSAHIRTLLNTAQPYTGRIRTNSGSGCGGGGSSPWRAGGAGGSCARAPKLVSATSPSRHLFIEWTKQSLLYLRPAQGTGRCYVRPSGPPSGPQVSRGQWHSSERGASLELCPVETSSETEERCSCEEELAPRPGSP